MKIGTGFGIMIGQFCYKIKHTLTLWPSNLCPLPKEDEKLHSHKTCTQKFRKPLLLITKDLKQHKCSLTDEWIHILWYIHKMEYYSSVKRNELNTHNNMDESRITLSDEAKSTGYILSDKRKSKALVRKLKGSQGETQTARLPLHGGKRDGKQRQTIPGGRI